MLETCISSVLWIDLGVGVLVLCCDVVYYDISSALVCCCISGVLWCDMLRCRQCATVWVACHLVSGVFDITGVPWCQWFAVSVMCCGWYDISGVRFNLRLAHIALFVYRKYR
jgi:hypothetical protein